ncbi:sensor histidine kinase [Tenacibaculum sp. MEBiC06402]|uniref:sensor histidine kinase n=1 Tax=unclassified Tenacibaculum TaxID=2635139 RepID=UPI003B9C053E
MNSLLKRQIRKYLPKDLQESDRLDAFLDAVNRSYENSDDQLFMLQRATAISSEELSEASEKLKKETNEQRALIEKLKNVFNTLKVDELEGNDLIESSSTLSLVDFIDNQTKEIVKINKQKDKLLHNLERQNQELNDYTHMISHDLVSPLQSIETLTQWLIDDHKENLNEEGRNHIELISEHVEKIDTLVASIRKYSRIIRTVKTHSDFHLNDVITSIERELKLSDNVKIIIPRRLPVLNGDKYCCKELFINLIDNAVKFNEKEEKLVEVGYEESDEHWQFYVKDNGKGIDSTYFEKVFVAFSKLENDYKSAGMGLSIVKKIVEVYKGKIWIESELNKGTTVYFTIKK